MGSLAAILLGGTLILMMPTHDGLVAVGDSRVMNEQKTLYCDDDHKLIDLGAEIPRTIIATTGISKLQDSKVVAIDFCAQVRQARTLLDIRQEFKEYVEKAGKSAKSLSLVGFGSILEDKFRTAIPGHEAYFALSLAGKEISTLTAATYEISTSTVWIRYAKLYVSSTFVPIIVAEEVKEFKLDHEFVYLKAGDTDYVNGLEASGQIWRNLDQQTLLVFSSPKLVRDVTRQEGLDAAASYMSAVIRISNSFPSHPGIGGPIDELFVGPQSIAERIKWAERP